MGNTQAHDSILVLDFGSQYNQLISRRIRELGVYSELKPHTLTAAEIKELNQGTYFLLADQIRFTKTAPSQLTQRCST